MNYKQRNTIINMMNDYADKESWMSGITKALMEQEGAAPSEGVAIVLLVELDKLWNIVHDPVDKVFAPYGIVDVSERFMIPYRTVQNWYRGERECTVWMRLLIRDALDRETDMPRKGRVRRPKNSGNTDD